MVTILETDRVIIKTFNALIANFIYPVRGKIQAFLQVEDNENMIGLLVENKQWKKDQELLDYLMTFIKESLKFMMMGFFKRCRIMTQILVNMKEKLFPDTREKIFSDYIAHNLRWCFVTIQTTIEAGCEDRDQFKGDYSDDDSAEA